MGCEQNLWNVVKTVPRGKFKYTNVYIKMEKNFK